MANVKGSSVCRTAVDEGKPDDCLCYHFIIRNKYWADFKYCIGEFLSGVIVSAILFSCCCLKK